MDSLVAVAEGDFTFDGETLRADALAHWPGSTFARRTGPTAELSDGQLALPDDDHQAMLLVDLMAGGKGLGVEGRESVAADFLAWLASRPGFPRDGSVVISDWTVGFFHLLPDMAAAEILAAHESAWRG